MNANLQPIRIARFLGYALINVQDELPPISPQGENARREWEINREVLRVLKERTCLYCTGPLVELPDHPGIVLGCQKCGYWAGRGTRDWGMGAADMRGAMAVVREEPLDSDDIPIQVLLNHLTTVPEHLLQLNPFRAEKVMADVIREAWKCEVKVVGGRRDKGIDAFIVVNDKFKTLIQIKWHKEKKKAESVKVVREVAGTLLARGVPEGILITTREKMSSDANREIDSINQHEIIGIGRLDLSAKTYDDIIGMLNLAWGNLGKDLLYSNPDLDPNEPGCLFGS